MSQSLGGRIKELRKELKMTQTDLAGSEMTKSMLSQIENSLATPSMKNLQYLAARLGKPVSYFLEDDTYQPSLPVDKIREELKEITALINNSKLNEALSKFQAMEEMYHFDHNSKLYADFLQKYGVCLIDLNKSEEGEQKILQAVDIYKNKYLFVDASRAFIRLQQIHWNNFDYHKCIDILEKAQEIYNNSINKDYAFEIEVLYLKSILLGGLDMVEDGAEAAEQALMISKQTNIYYRSDELYKTLAIMNVFLDKTADFDSQMEKARHFAIFAEKYDNLASIEAVCGMYRNLTGDYPKAIEYLDLALQYSDVISDFAHSEKSKSYYFLGQYQAALDLIRLIKYPKYIPFKYDYLHIWSSKTYEGLCLSKLGRPQEAVAAIKQGIEKMEVVNNSKTLAFAYKSLSEVYSDMGDYENAFAALKQANEISEIVKEHRLYY